MATIPSLALIPSGYKASKVYSVLPTDGTGDFDFTRSGNATRVNSEGLIELVTSSVPRLNYPLIDGIVQGCPSLLLEPQRTNLALYSEQMNNAAWTAINCTVSANAATSPDGYTNADSISTTAANSFFGAASGVTISADASTYTQSVFMKWVSGSEIVKLRAALTGGTSVAKETIANVRTGVITYTDSTAQIVSYGNGWYRISQQITNNSTNTNFNYQFYPTNDGTNTNVISLWGCMAEIGAYATSYIPTSGTTATRSAETCNNAGDVNTFNNSEGVLFAEISGLADDGTNRRISISDGSTSDRIVLGYTASPNQLIVLVSSNSVSGVASIVNINNSLQFNKIALKYKLNDFALWINGIEVLTDNSLNSPIGLNDLSFEGADNLNDFYGSTKQIQYYNTALNDSDLETLTSWDSFSDMATSQLYTIE
jgi:hypothetical protein